MIYLSSFSKVLMPGLRIGLLAPPPHLLDILIATKRLSDIQSPQLTQRVLALYLRTPTGAQTYVPSGRTIGSDPT